MPMRQPMRWPIHTKHNMVLVFAEEMLNAEILETQK